MIKNLTCNYENYPINVDRKAIISWEITNGFQENFSIDLKVDNKNVYNSGKIISPDCNFYLDYPFQPTTSYLYTLKVQVSGKIVEQNGCFRTTLINGFCEKAKWIGAKPIDQAQQKQNGNPATYLYKKFRLDSVQTTFLYISGLGLYEVYINNKKVGDRVLNCPFTNYNASVFYDTYEVTHDLQVGENILQIVLGDGWYNQTTIDTWDFNQASWRDNCKVLFQLEGENIAIYSDESFKVSTNGQIRSSSLRLGEQFDANSIIDFSQCSNAVLVDQPRGKLKSQDSFPIRECEILEFVSVEEYDGKYLLDFGKNIAGYCRLDLNLTDKQTVKIRYGDHIVDGKLDNQSNLQYIYNINFDYQMDSYTAKGNQRVSYSPSFVYHGFQYMEIEGFGRKPNISEIKAVFIHSDFKQTGYFLSSDELLNRLYEMSVVASQGNFVGFPTDCPHREKNGWTGDLSLSIDQFVMNFNISSNLIKWLEDIEESQINSGQIPCIIPTSTWGYAWGSGPAWDMALFNVVFHLHKYANNVYVVKRFMGVLERYYAYLSKKAEGNLIEFGLGDWNFPKNVEVKVASTKLTDSCFYHLMTTMLSEFYLMLGQNEQSEYLRTKAIEIKRAIVDCFIDAEGNVDNNGMTALAAPLFFNLVDGPIRENIFNKLIAEIEKQDYHYRAGILGVKFINNVLCENKRVDLFIKLMRKRSYPSFAHWIDLKATTLWEDFEGTNSHNHHMFSDIAAIMLKYIAGIRKEEGRIIIEPEVYDLTHFQAKTNLSNGDIVVRFLGSDREWQFEIEFPANTYGEFRQDNKITILKTGMNRITGIKIKNEA